MIRVVLDTSIVVAAIYWPRSTARRVLAALARRYYGLLLSDEIFVEYSETAAELQARFSRSNSQGPLAWLRYRAEWVERVSLGRQCARDLEDEVFLATAVAGAAKFIVSNDRDLLDLKKPFGIEIVTPVPFLLRLQERSKGSAG